MAYRNLVDLFQQQAENYGEKPVLRFKQSGVYVNVTWASLKSIVIRVAHALKGMGIQKGDCVGLLSENRPEWVYADLGSLTVGAVVVPIHATASNKEVEYILDHCSAKILFLSSQSQLDRILPLKKRFQALKTIIILDDVPKVPDGCRLFNSFLCQNEERPIADDALSTHASEIALDDVATIIYTSGTTGPSKGVMLSHRNLLVNCYDTIEVLPIVDSDISLSFLPLSHVFERMGGYYLSFLAGATIAYAQSMATVSDDIEDIKPTVACAVPRFFEKMCAGIHEHASQFTGLRKRIFFWALAVGKECAAIQCEGGYLPLVLWLKKKIATRLVFSKLYKKLGGRLRFFVSGGAPLPKELAEFFYSVGVLILEGYGLTETSPVISVNQYKKYRFGSVGLPLKSVETKIAEDQEICVKGPSVMKGYYKNEKATTDAIKNQWFHTGDLGRFDDDGFLYIVGRKKDIIVTSAGKNVAPQNIENIILGDPAISQIMLLGDRRNYCTALVVPNQMEVIRTLDLPLDTSMEQLVQDAHVHELIRDKIKNRSSELASHEQIKYFTLISREFSQDREEMTLTMKVKRQVVEQHYQDAIDKMYEGAKQSGDGSRSKLFYVF